MDNKEFLKLAPEPYTATALKDVIKNVERREQ